MNEFAIGMILGTLAGVCATVFSEPIIHFFRRRSLRHHLRADLRNLDQHFSIVHSEFRMISEEPLWKQRSRLRWSTFATRGLFTHNHNDLFMLRKKEADVIVRHLIMVHNYDSTCEEVLQSLDEKGFKEGQIEELERRSSNLASRARELSKAI